MGNMWLVVASAPSPSVLTHKTTCSPVSAYEHYHWSEPQREPYLCIISEQGIVQQAQVDVIIIRLEYRWYVSLVCISHRVNCQMRSAYHHDRVLGNASFGVRRSQPRHHLKVASKPCRNSSTKCFSVCSRGGTW